MNTEEKFQQFLQAIDEELIARVGITSEDLPDYDYYTEFLIGSTVAETVDELLIQNSLYTD